MKELNILITGAGSPGIKGTIFCLKNNFDKRKITITGVDINYDAAGKYFCNNFEIIRRFTDENHYIDDLLRLSKKYFIDAIIPQNTGELELLSNNINLFEQIGTKVLISNY